MSTSSRPARGDSPSSLNLPFLLVAAILSGLGVFLMAYWMITQDLLYFAGGVVLAGSGGYLLFQPGTGAETG